MNDPLLLIVAVASAIMFGYLGYVAGNYFPVIKREQRKGVNLEKAGETASEFINRLLGRGEETAEADAADDDEARIELDDPDAPVIETPAPAAPAPALPAKAAKPAPAGGIAPPSGKTGGLHVWHDRDEQKVFAWLGGEWIDLDSKLTAGQHGELSLLLVDMQEKVGVLAGLKAAAKEVDESLEKEKEKEGGFNPLKSFVNYVQADVPKLDDHEETIPEQINAILQEKIKGTYLAKRGISVTQWPDRGVVFVVGVDVYDDIHKIPDSDVRFAIRGAVKMWEVQQEKKAKDKKK